MAGGLDLPVVDLASPDLRAAAASVRRACVEHGFFYVANHGVDAVLLGAVFAESRRFFGLPLGEKMALRTRTKHRGYIPLYTQKLDASESRGDVRECFSVGPTGDGDWENDVNQWPAKEHFLDASKRILSLIALSLDLDAEFFQKIGAFDNPSSVIRLLHYPGEGEVNESDSGNYGASAHSDYGMITLLATDGTPGLQICREKDRQPQLWEDVHHIDGALIVNIGDLLERWTNFLFRSTLHRVVGVGKERYSVAFFLNPNPDLVVECLESCCSEANPPRFPPIRSGDYLKERLNASYKIIK
ncbi:hypothetical protein ACP70R_019518 [Stipagrostis hirtigluma subsp. patula]